MFTFVSVLLLYTFVRNGVTAGNSDVAFRCNPNITNMDYEPVNTTTYCKDRPCIAKCCGENEVLLHISARIPPKCIKISTIDLKNSTNLTLDYSNLHIYKSDIENEIHVTEKKFQDFKLVRNYVPVNSSCGQVWRKSYAHYILENGQFAGDMTDSHDVRWHIKDALSYCVEIRVRVAKNTKGDHGPPMYISNYTFYLHRPEPKSASKLTFSAVAMLISSCFLLLVLAVYCVLPQLRNLSGMLLMAYASALATAYMMKASILFNPGIHTTSVCEVISPIMYFSFLSSFFWLNTMSFDIWRAFRRMTLKQGKRGQSEVIKFLRYGLYAWGVPVAMTVGAVLIDHVEQTRWPRVTRPRFPTCFYEQKPNKYYVYAPISILTVINIVLFLMTVYNMRMVKNKVNNFSRDSRNTKNENTFYLYLKISVLMGTSWLLEVVQVLYSDESTALYVVMNLYNSFIGVAVFIMFVLNKPTLEKLCKRFKNKRECGQGATVNTSAKSTVSRNRRSTAALSKGSCSTKNTADDDHHPRHTKTTEAPNPIAKNNRTSLMQTHF